MDSQVERILLECRSENIQNIPRRLPELLAMTEGLDLDYVHDSSSSEPAAFTDHTLDKYTEVQKQCFICTQSYNFPEYLLAELDDCIKSGEQATKAWISQIVNILGDPNRNIRPVRTKCGHIMCEAVSWSLGVLIT